MSHKVKATFNLQLVSQIILKWKFQQGSTLIFLADIDNNYQIKCRKLFWIYILFNIKYLSN